MLRSFPKSYFRLLKLDTSDEIPSSWFGSGSNTFSPSLSYDRHQDADPSNTQASQEGPQTEARNFEDVVFSKPPLSCFSPSSPYNGPVPSCRPSLSSFLQPIRTVIDAPSRSAHLSPSSSTSLPGIAAISTSEKARSFPLLSEAPRFSVESRT